MCWPIPSKSVTSTGESQHCPLGHSCRHSHTGLLRLSSEAAGLHTQVFNKDPSQLLAVQSVSVACAGGPTRSSGPQGRVPGLRDLKVTWMLVVPGRVPHSISTPWHPARPGILKDQGWPRSKTLPLPPTNISEKRN